MLSLRDDQRGLFEADHLKLALDTTAVVGQGAVKDAYNLLGDGIRKLIWGASGHSGRPPEARCPCPTALRLIRGSRFGKLGQGRVVLVGRSGSELVEAAPDRLGFTREGHQAPGASGGGSDILVSAH